MNTKTDLYKEKLKLEREIYELEEIQRKNTRWVKLDVPYRNGYYKTYELRPDIKNRDDAWVFEEIIKITVQRIFGKNKHFRVKYKKGHYEVRRPDRRYISENTYISLKPQVKKHFRPVDHFDKHYNPWRKEYTATVPEYYFVEKIKPRWITHELVCDVDVSKELAEKNTELRSQKFHKLYWNWGSAPSWYCATFNRADRRHNKQEIKKMIESGDFDSGNEDLRYNHRHGATWMWW